MHTPHAPAVVERYNATAQLFHWLTALLVVVAYTVSVGGSETHVYSPTNDFSRGLHELLGMTVFGLTLVRAWWRAIWQKEITSSCRYRNSSSSRMFPRRNWGSCRLGRRSGKSSDISR